MSVASIKRHIDDLENAGLLKKVHTFKDNIQKSNQYILALPGSSIWTAPQLTMSYPPAQFELQKQEVKQEKNNTLFDSSHLFDIFWKAYPRKVSPANAKRSFAKLKVDEEMLKKMLHAIEAQKRSVWLDKDPQYIPHPSTWLNGERWEDEVAVPAQPRNGLAGAI
jgi:hypothetical protein